MSHHAHEIGLGTVTLSKLFLHTFRNCSEELYEFGPGFNLLFGQNGEGKTSVLEAIHLLSIGRSFRTYQLSDLIQKEHPFFQVEAHFVTDEGRTRASFRSDGKQRQVFLDGAPLKSLSELLGLFPSVTFISGHELIRGTPRDRRRFLDLFITQREKSYLHHLSRFARAVSQRNQLLKLKQPDALGPWEEEMAKSATVIVQKRQEALAAIEPLAKEQFEALTETPHDLGLSYSTSQPLTEEDFLKKWHQERSKEMKFGQTLFGPHRDDLFIHSHGQPAKTFLSAGQQWIVGTALKLAGLQFLKEATGRFPLVLIDDFGLHLDDERQQNYLNLLSTLGQVFITTQEPLERFQFHNDLKRFEITQGHFKR